MTIQQIIESVKPFKRCSRGTIYTYLKDLKIRPVSKRRQLPQQYPDDAAERIKIELGSGVVSMRRLSRERVKAQKARAVA